MEGQNYLVNDVVIPRHRKNEIDIIFGQFLSKQTERGIILWTEKHFSIITAKRHLARQEVGEKEVIATLITVSCLHRTPCQELKKGTAKKGRVREPASY